MSFKKSVRFRPSTESKFSVTKGFNSTSARTTTRLVKKIPTTPISPFASHGTHGASNRTKRNRIPASFLRSNYAFKGSQSLDRISLDHPEVIKDKAKKLVTELERKNIILNDVSIEKIIRGDPKEYIEIYRRLFTCHRSTLRSLKHCPSRSCTDLMDKFDGKVNEGVIALFAIVSQKLGIKLSLNPGQFLQNRFAVQKLVLCYDVTQKLSYHRSGFI